MIVVLLHYKFICLLTNNIPIRETEKLALIESWDFFFNMMPFFQIPRINTTVFGQNLKITTPLDF